MAIRRLWIILPKNHFTEKIWLNAFHRKFGSPNTVWPNAVRSKVHFTELTFHRKKISKGSFDRIYFRQKMSFKRKKSRQKVIWPNNLLTESFFEKRSVGLKSFDRKFILPKAFFEKWSHDRKVIWPRVYFTESFKRCSAKWRSVFWLFSEKVKWSRTPFSSHLLVLA
jgi:hypothetical protein